MEVLLKNSNARMYRMNAPDKNQMFKQSNPDLVKRGYAVGLKLTASSTKKDLVEAVFAAEQKRFLASAPKSVPAVVSGVSAAEVDKGGDTQNIPMADLGVGDEGDGLDEGTDFHPLTDSVCGDGSTCEAMTVSDVLESTVKRIRSVETAIVSLEKEFAYFESMMNTKLSLLHSAVEAVGGKVKGKTCHTLHGHIDDLKNHVKA